MKSRMIIILSVVSTFVGLMLVGLVIYLINRERRIVLDLTDETPQALKVIAYGEGLFPQSINVESLLAKLFKTKPGEKPKGLAKYLSLRII